MGQIYDSSSFLDGVLGGQFVILQLFQFILCALSTFTSSGTFVTPINTTWFKHVQMGTLAINTTNDRGDTEWSDRVIACVGLDVVTQSVYEVRNGDIFFVLATVRVELITGSRD
ncbi:hypothetical protein WICPIJ_000131 [Wickerhamomyces pijperi]|uniref:Uncharacterized protein n=1 Tax=Wickerhamomyces pijperi TaxID=599730 RepID=A0A9P8QEJ7_WICPI|nr:hypothetical protein WICPIJ_000131 [Wickerhamomyces pijperi]